MKVKETYTVNFPAWALGAVINNDWQGLSEIEKLEVLQWLEDNPGNYSAGEEEYFCKFPEFGLACNCVELGVAVVEKGPGFTPGPWISASASSGQGLVYSESNGRSIAVAYERKNAGLISAAPDLFESLRDMVRLHDDAAGDDLVNDFEISGVIAAAREALEKAGGQGGGA